MKPSNPRVGDLWRDPETGHLYRFEFSLFAGGRAWVEQDLILNPEGGDFWYWRAKNAAAFQLDVGLRFSLAGDYLHYSFQVSDDSSRFVI